MKNLRKSIPIVMLLCLTPDYSEAQTSWRVPLTIDCEEYSIRLYFGLHPDATDHFDIGIDTMAPPPAFEPYAYFYIDTFPNFLQTDMRNSDNEVTWELRTSNCTGKSVILRWNSEDYLQIADENAYLEIVGYTDMTSVDSLRIVGDISVRIRFSNTTFAVLQSKGKWVPDEEPIIAFPNPFNDRVTLQLRIRKSCRVNVRIYDLGGRYVTELFWGFLPTGIHRFNWSGLDQNGDPMPTGLYLCRGRWDRQEVCIKVQLIR